MFILLFTNNNFVVQKFYTLKIQIETVTAFKFREHIMFTYLINLLLCYTYSKLALPLNVNCILFTSISFSLKVVELLFFPLESYYGHSLIVYFIDFCVYKTSVLMTSQKRVNLSVMILCCSTNSN